MHAHTLDTCDVAALDTSRLDEWGLDPFEFDDTELSCHL